MSSNNASIRTEIEKLVAQYNQRRIKYVKRRRIGVSAENWILLALILGTISVAIIVGKYTKSFFPIFLTLIGGGFLASVTRRVITGEDKRVESVEQSALLQALLPRIFHELEDFKYDPNPYPKLKLSPLLMRRCTKQVRGQKVSAKIEGTFFTLHELELKNETSDSTTTIFKGVLFAFNLPKWRSGKIYIKQNKRLFQFMPPLTGPEEPDFPHIRTGNNDFDSKFEIHGSDERHVKEIFTKQGMSKFLEALEQFDPGEFAMEVDEQVVTMMIQTHLPIFQLNDMKNKMDSTSDIKMLKNQLAVYEQLMAKLQKVFGR